MIRIVATTLTIALAGAVLAPARAQVGHNKNVLNPNRATDKELLAQPHITTELAAAIIEQRPLLTMAALHELLSKTLTAEQTAELYKTMFVPLNLNTATRAEILLVPGVGPKLAHEFEEYRPYIRLEQFHREIGKYVDKEEVARLAQYVFVPIRLNDASDADILSIPGVGRRMLHEFKEYRPYRNIEQFRREIGKYVDAKELARLERYVTLRPAPAADLPKRPKRPGAR